MTQTGERKKKEKKLAPGAGWIHALTPCERNNAWLPGINTCVWVSRVYDRWCNTKQHSNIIINWFDCGSTATALPPTQYGEPLWFQTQNLSTSLHWRTQFCFSAAFKLTRNVATSTPREPEQKQTMFHNNPQRLSAHIRHVCRAARRAQEVKRKSMWQIYQRYRKKWKQHYRWTTKNEDNRYFGSLRPIVKSMPATNFLYWRLPLGKCPSLPPPLPRFQSNMRLQFS